MTEPVPEVPETDFPPHVQEWLQEMRDKQVEQDNRLTAIENEEEVEEDSRVVVGVKKEADIKEDDYTNILSTTVESDLWTFDYKGGGGTLLFGVFDTDMIRIGTTLGASVTIRIYVNDVLASEFSFSINGSVRQLGNTTFSADVTENNVIRVAVVTFAAITINYDTKGGTKMFLLELQE